VTIPIVVVALAIARQTAPEELTLGIAPPDGCAMCHSDAAAQNLAFDTYRGTMMHLASVDPVFLAAREIAVADDEEAAAVCNRCHVPTGWLAGRGDPPNGAALSQADLQGIACDLCHRMTVPAPPSDGGVIVDGGPLDAGLVDGGALDGGVLDGGVPNPDFSALFDENGQLFIFDGTTKHGPIADPVANGNHASVYSPLFRSSHLCGQCHNVTHPTTERVDPDDGTPLGHNVPEQRTFAEWQASSFAEPGGKQCQDCHMPRFDGFAVSNGNVPERSLAGHRIVGANTIAPLLVAAIPAGPSRPEFLDGIGPAAALAVDEAIRLLTEESATLEIVADDDTGVVARVTNKTGHKLPTGYSEGRRMWLAHRVDYADGVQGPRSGTPDATTFDFVDGEEPLRVYEIKLGEPDGERRSTSCSPTAS
jgi:hypothetical protein